MRPLLISALLLLVPLPLLADEIGQVPASATFVISGGFWDAGADGLPLSGSDAKLAGKGYYKLISIRQADRSSKLYLQTVRSGDAGPEIIQSVELDEFTAIKPYVTGIQPEGMDGVKATPGFFATVYLKTDPTSERAEEWTVLIDDLGDIKVERASN